MTVKVYPYVDGREIHQVGNDVAVVWNANRVTKEIVKDGITYTAQVPVRNGEPYIDFVSLIADDKGELHENDYDLSHDGMDAEEALSLSKQLADAAEYLKGLRP